MIYYLPLVKGNAKIGENVWHGSTMPTNEDISVKLENGDVVTIKGTCPIKCEGCYALAGNFRYNSTKFYLMKRTELLRKHMAVYFALVKLQIKHENIKLLRVHASGDFIKGEGDGWRDVFETFPNIKGWTYTKHAVKGEIARLDSLQNFNIVKSCIAGCGFNFGHIGYILSVYDKLVSAGENVYICRCGIDKNQHCENCGGCAKNKYVLFIEHSTEYKAEKDPLYNKMKDLIESQPKIEL